MFRIITLILVAAFSVGQARADVRIEINSLSYELNGTTLATIHEDIHRKGRQGSEIVDGEVSDRFSLALKLAKIGGLCRIKADEVLLKLNILLPNWVDEQHADISVRAAWRTYFKKLKAHEDGHKAIAVAAAYQINQAIHMAEPRNTCSSMRMSLGNVAEKIIKAAEREQNQFDATQTPFDLK